MQEKGNKFKPISKKEVPLLINKNQETTLTQESKLSSNSQNKLFIRKPVSKRNGYVSPSFTKNRVAQNEEVRSPTDQQKGKKCIQSDSHSDQDYWENNEKTGFVSKMALKNYITIQQGKKQQLSKQSSNAYSVNEAYYGNESHALTQIGEHYKVQTIESDNSQKDLYSKQNMKRNSKQNIVVNSLNLNTKKVTRTEYFANPNTEQVRPMTSRSLKEKQLNFNMLRHSVNNNIEAYVLSLEDSIRKLQKNNYTLNKKCKWMHEEVQMHLEKQHLMTAEKKGFQLQLKAKDKQRQILNQEKSDIKKQLDQLKLWLQNKETPKRYKSFKDLETISSLKQFCSNVDQKNFGKITKIQQNPQGYFGFMPPSIDKNKKKSFKTYPGVCSPKNSREDGSKCSSIAGNNHSFQDFGQSSILQEKSNIKSQLTNSKYSVIAEDLKRQKEELRASLECLTAQMNLLKEKTLQKVTKNSQQFEIKLIQQSRNFNKLKNDFDTVQNDKQMLLIEIDKIQSEYQTQIQSLNANIRELESQISLQSRNSVPSGDLNLQAENPLKYFLQNTEKCKNFAQASQAQNLELQNKSLRMYIQKVIEHYKYMKIENRILLKVKEDKEKLEKEKKQIKDQRDSFKRKLLQMLKNQKNLGKQPTKSCRRLMDFGSESSEEQDSAVFQLSQSEIKQNEQSKYERTEN